MVIAKNHTRRLFTLTEEEADQTGEAMLIDHGFVTVPMFHDSRSNPL